ncbi:hypothetical protein [Aquimarina algiphila]|nr:hypothetical protein [Aquimarina algiphila]
MLVEKGTTYQNINNLYSLANAFSQSIVDRKQENKLNEAIK